MRIDRFSFIAIVAAAFACDKEIVIEPAAQPSWVGVYTLRADTVRYCVENQTPSGRTCDCTAPGYLQGTLTLMATADGKPPGERLSFCAGKCPFTGNDGGIQFINAAIPANPLSGQFSRADGNIRYCGADSGPFTATKP